MHDLGRLSCYRCDMIADDREWHKQEGATPDQLRELRSVLAIELPDTYWQLLSHSNGGEGPLAVQPCYFQLDSAEDSAGFIKAKPYGDQLDGFHVFGSNGGGEFIAFDLTGASPWPVVYIDMVAGRESARTIAPDFESFLELVGRDA